LVFNLAFPRRGGEDLFLQGAKGKYIYARKGKTLKPFFSFHFSFSKREMRMFIQLKKIAQKFLRIAFKKSHE